MNKYTVDIGINTKGYTDGVNQAKEANAEFVSSVNVSDKEIKKLMQEYRKAQKDATGLALAFNRLSDAQKKSAEGQALARNLAEAKKQAAELLDVVSDVKEEIKHAASDTANWDAIKSGVEVGRDAITAFAALTGTEEELGKVIKKIAQIQTAANAVITIGNALQRQSALMAGVRRVQEIALSKAINLETSSTVGATVAQKAFNIVAKANPYVLLATTAIAAASAIYMFTKGAKEETEAEKKAREENEKVQEALKEYKKSLTDLYSSTVGKLLGSFTKLRAEWNNLKTDAQKTKWIKDNQNAFNELGVSIKNVKDAEDVFINNAQAMVSAIMLRAKAAVLLKQIEDQMANAAASGVSADGKNEDGTYNIDYAGAQHSAQQYVKVQEEINSLMSQFKTNSGGASKALTKQTTELQKLQAEVNKYKTQLENIDIHAPNVSEVVASIQRDLKKAEANLKSYKITVGIETPKSKLDELKDDLKQAEAELPFAISDEDVQAAHKKIEDLKNQIESEEVRLGIKVEPKSDGKDLKDAQGLTQEIIHELNNPTEIKSYDFSVLGEEQQKKAEEAIASYERVKAAREQLIEIMETSTDDSAIAAAQDGLETIHEGWMQLCDDVETYQSKAEEVADNMKKVQKTMSAINSVGSSAASMFTALGEATGDEGFAVAGLIAQAIAQVALGYATATAQASEMGPWAWIAFALAGLATMITMINQIKSQTAGSYAEGGIIPGNSYYGDKLTARVNSGEMILNSKQQKRLFDIANGKGFVGNADKQMTSSISSVAVEGSDLVLAIKNELKTTGETL